MDPRTWKKTYIANLHLRILIKLMLLCWSTPPFFLDISSFSCWLIIFKYSAALGSTWNRPKYKTQVSDSTFIQKEQGEQQAHKKKESQDNEAEQKHKTESRQRTKCSIVIAPNAVKPTIAPYSVVRGRLSRHKAQHSVFIIRPDKSGYLRPAGRATKYKTTQVITVSFHFFLRGRWRGGGWGEGGNTTYNNKGIAHLLYRSTIVDSTTAAQSRTDQWLSNGEGEIRFPTKHEKIHGSNWSKYNSTST